MRAISHILASLAVLLLASCSSDTLKRNTYQSLQIMQQRECLQQHSTKCPPSESYNKYQKQREDALKK